MASNKDLAEQATALAVELGQPVKTEGLKNPELQELVADLQKRLGRSPATAASEAPTPPPEPPKAPEAPAAAVPVAAPPPAAKPKRPPVDGARADGAGGPPEPPKAPTPKLRHPYQVAPGKALTVLRGVLGPGDEVRASDFASEGAKQLEHLVERGYVLKRG